MLHICTLHPVRETKSRTITQGEYNMHEGERPLEREVISELILKRYVLKVTGFSWLRAWTNFEHF
jgi:hypothetical protein